MRDEQQTNMAVLFREKRVFCSPSKQTTLVLRQTQFVLVSTASMKLMSHSESY